MYIILLLRVAEYVLTAKRLNTLCTTGGHNMYGTPVELEYELEYPYSWFVLKTYDLARSSGYARLYLGIALSHWICWR
jgi:hypothetical protein